MTKAIKVTYVIIEGLDESDIPRVMELARGADVIAAQDGPKTVGDRPVERTEVSMAAHQAPAIVENAAKKQEEAKAADAEPAPAKTKKAKKPEPEPEEPAEAAVEEEAEESEPEEPPAKPAKVKNGKLAVPDHIANSTKVREIIDWLQKKHGLNYVDEIVSVLDSLKDQIPRLQRISDLRNRVSRLLESEEA